MEAALALDKVLMAKAIERNIALSALMFKIYYYSLKILVIPSVLIPTIKTIIGNKYCHKDSMPIGRTF
jgi:hypothetical protein